MILSAKEVKENKTEQLKSEIASLSGKAKLAIIVVGDESASAVYVRNKLNYAKEVGVETELVSFNEDVTEQEILECIDRLNKDESVNGLFVQLPVPKHIDETKIIKAIDPSKDVDGFCFENIGKMFVGDETGLFPCTVEGIFDILEHYQIEVAGKNVCMVGRSNIVGKPMSLRLINKGATVTTCNSMTKDVKGIIEKSDILISAIGRANYFDETYFTNTPNLVIIDVGMNRDEHNKLCGDVDFKNIENQVKAVTPVPGGVGVMTVVKVIENVVKAYRLQKGE